MNMNKYKVGIEVTRTYVVDVLALSETSATFKAMKKWQGIVESGMEHYHEDRDALTQVSQVYDVTNTDDPFDATV